MRIRSLVVAALVVVVLSGCVTAPTASPTPSQTASPTPTGIVVPEPQSRLPLTCDELVAPATVATLSAQPVLLIDAATDVPDHWWDVIERQAGALTCGWGLDAGSAVLDVRIVPDAAEQYQWVVDEVAVPSHYERFDAVGDRSLHSCAYGTCSFSILVGDHLIRGFLQIPDLMDELDLEPVAVPVMREIADAVGGAIPDERPAWAAPDGVLRGWGFLGDGPWADVAAIVGLEGAFLTGTDFDPASAAMLGAVDPSWLSIAVEDGSRHTSLVLVEGGAWASNLWLTEPPTWFEGDDELVEVDGVGAVHLNDLGSSFTAMFALEGSLVSFSADATSRDEFLGWTAEVAQLLVEDAAAS